MVRQLTKKDAYSAFEYALKAPETKRQWPRRLDVFLTFLRLEGSDVKERSNILYDLIKTEGIDWLESHIIDFVYFQKQRVLSKEITDITINNYIKPLKTFCDMNNIILNWKYIRKGVPKGRKSALDRIPEVSEVKKLLRASDIRLKPIISVMLSSTADVGCSIRAQENIKNIEKLNPEVFLVSGDLSYEKTLDCWFDMTKSLDSKTKVTIGNHDDGYGYGI